MVASTQGHLPVQDIHDDVVILKDGSLAVVIQTSAVNFGLLSENEQLAIISAFAAMLNSLSFMIQIIIRSKRLDITSYLKQLDEAQARQKNQLLASMIGRYRAFIRNTIQENQVLDKQFYIVIPVSYLETGAISKSVHYDFKKALTVAIPRRDQIIRQLARIGLKSNQLRSEELVKLFYDIYNPSDLPPELHDAAANEQAIESVAAVMAANTTDGAQTYRAASDADLINAKSILENERSSSSNEQNAPTPAQPAQPVSRPETPFPPSSATQRPVIQPASPRRKPFVVEELKEEYGTV